LRSAGFSAPTAFAAAAALVLAGGCTQPFLRPAPEELKIGETTPAQIVERVRRNPVYGTLQRNGRTLQMVAFAQDAEWERPHGYDGVIPSRTQVYYFLDGKLAGYEFNSTVESDHTDFSARGTRDIVKGRTAREELAKLLGPPSGYLAYPLVEKGSAMTWSYRETRRVPMGKPFVYAKFLIIFLNENGIVDDFNYTTTGTP